MCRIDSFIRMLPVVSLYQTTTCSCQRGPDRPEGKAGLSRNLGIAEAGIPEEQNFAVPRG
jgi:hypothetical protein